MPLPSTPLLHMNSGPMRCLRLVVLGETVSLTHKTKTTYAGMMMGIL